MNPRTTHTTTYFTCRWLVVVLAIFFFADIHVLPARAQELPETTTETTQELDGQATTIEATQEQSGQVATTETTQESYNSQTITESGQQTNVIYDSIFDESGRGGACVAATGHSDGYANYGDGKKTGGG